MFQKKSKNGITLISLVITIIVMLILAGVTISITVGDNGILTQAQNAVEKNRQATALEDVKMAWASLQAEYYSDWARNTGIRFGDIVTKDNLQKYLNGSGTVNNITDNGDGTYLIEYTANEEGKAYLFLADENGNVIMLNGLNITPSVLSLQIITEGTEVTNGTGTLQASLTGISGNVTWTSSNTSIVSIIGNGNTATVRAEGEGTATITATCNSGGETYTDESTITVTEVTAVTEISSLVPSLNTVNRGESIQITATVNSGATEELVWTSSDENVTIGEPVISGNTQTVTIAVLSETIPGEKTITATAVGNSSITATCNITVVEPVVAFENIGEAIGGEYYGTTITTGVTSVNGQTISDNWKIFYADDTYVYLIYGGEDFSYNDNSFVHGYYYGANEVIAYLKNNSNYDYTEYTTNKDYDSVGPVAGSFNDWTNLLNAFKNSSKLLAQKAVSVQGSPNLTMWVASWNKKYGLEDGIVEKLKTIYIGANDYGYLIGTSSDTEGYKDWENIGISFGEGNSTTETGYYDSLYFPPTSNEWSSYVLSSPSGGNDVSDENFVYVVRASGYIDGDVLYGDLPYFCFVRPVISILKSDFNQYNENGITID